MAELASGAVSSLLGVIRNEALLLGRVRHDVQFIREEMESMQSFLTHLSKKAPAGGEHDEQIRTWMNQVRLLAQDSNNCIDLYLYRGNPDLHLARGGLRRYVAWLPDGFMGREKNSPAHGDGDGNGFTIFSWDGLRQRTTWSDGWPPNAVPDGYGVEVPSKGAGAEQPPGGAGLTPAATSSSLGHVATWSAASGDEEEDGREQLVVAMAATDHSVLRGAFFEPRRPEDNVRLNLAKWINNVAQRNTTAVKPIPSIAIVAPDEQETSAIAAEASALWEEHHGTRSVALIDIPAVHFYSDFLEAEDIVYYILRELQSVEIQHQLQKGQLQLNQMNEYQLGLLESVKDEPLGVLLQALWQLNPMEANGAPTTKQSQENKKATRSEKKEPTRSERKKATHTHDDIIKETAKKLKGHMEKDADEKSRPKEHMEEDDKLRPKEHMEEEEKLKPEEDMEEQASPKQIRLEEGHYADILLEVFPRPVNLEQDSKQATPTGTSILVEEPFKEIIRKIMQEVQEDNSISKLDISDGKQSQDCIPDFLIEETIQKIEEIHWKIEQQLLVIKGIMDRFSNFLERHHQILVILKLDNDWVFGWEETKNAFSMLGCIAGALMLTFEENRDEAKEYCCPPQEPIDYSVICLYRDIALELTNQHMKQDSTQILLDILEKCKKYEFCMKIFVHALNANPKRSKEELSKLDSTLQQLPDNSLDNVAKKMFKFCYSDLPNEYKSCLLYLAIFPRRQPIRRSTLIGRWVVEGLITKEDWASSVRHANRCFDVLVNRWLIYPADIGATGKIKSCVIGDLVHAFITRIARKRRIVETRLSHHLALRFSIFNDLRLRGKNQSYLMDICSKMLLLKYLSLRRTDVTQLPTEINNLRELEVLDIRETNVPPYATVNVLLLKLKRLLAGRIVLSSGASSTELSSVVIPDKVEKMINMEVLSNVKGRTRQDFKDIGKLWQLRKLGVVIENKEPHLRNFLRAISDLHECLKSLSITLSSTEGSKDFTPYVLEHYKNTPKLLESLSITGTTQTVQLIRLSTRDNGQLQLGKVTLSGTRLSQADLNVLAKLPKLICLRLRDNAYIDSNLNFIEDEFENLKCFLIEGSNITVLNFGGGAHKLEKIVLCSTEGLSISGVEDLLELKEVELKNCNKLLLFDKAKNISKVTLCHTSVSQYEVEILAKMPNMRNLVLKDIFCVQSQLILYKGDFPKLNLLTLDFSVTPKIIITDGSAAKLEKIIWSFTKDTVGTLSISCIDILPNLKELELNGDFVPGEVEEALKKHKNKPKFTHNKPEYQYQEAGNIPEKKDPPRFSLFRKQED
ncbi:hypothetical protein CFC21_095682 [Triticum aestivum]|uniref:Rx N-terminal domain-containing protein n=2 Tax=Triticum aestivum TaxID=4565 RepID=A0A9R1LQK5_WHEAT|nr:hypothetical protein CFC21_095682 [Triticum aestivum]